MYALEERIKAVELKYDRKTAAVIRELSYPDDDYFFLCEGYEGILMVHCESTYGRRIRTESDHQFL